MQSEWGGRILGTGLIRLCECRFDAVGLVTATNVWVDGCELQDQLSGEYVVPDTIPPGWQVSVLSYRLKLPLAETIGLG
jgi:hypothetical protein